ncbi:GapA-binding peptide SR1P [Paenibacillus sp. FJAT-26967]|nr:GapA-binding peptide SR1P [Paenibacillus sp. FJAT-26967]
MEWGTLICKHCGSIVGSMDTVKITKYYVECKDEACVTSRSCKVHSGKK